MDWTGKLKSYVLKYRYVLLILMIGIFLMLLPDRDSEEPQSHQQAIVETEENLQTSLEEILSRIHGAGRVKLLLTQSAGERFIYQTDDDMSSSTDSSDTRTQTVIITSADRDQQALVRQILPPSYLGAVVVCDGGDDPSVKLAIVDAVSKATGLTADKITVLKMK